MARNPISRTDEASLECSRELTPQQEEAISLILGGKSATDTATQLGIGRRTLYRWQHEDPAFIAALNGWRREVAAVVRTRLLSLSGAAVDTVYTAIEKGDAKLAMQLLKQLGSFDREPAGSDNPNVIALEMELTRRTTEQQQAKKKFGLEMGFDDLTQLIALAFVMAGVIIGSNA